MCGECFFKKSHEDSDRIKGGKMNISCSNTRGVCITHTESNQNSKCFFRFGPCVGIERWCEQSHFASNYSNYCHDSTERNLGTRFKKVESKQCQHAKEPRKQCYNNRYIQSNHHKTSLQYIPIVERTVVAAVLYNAPLSQTYELYTLANHYTTHNSTIQNQSRLFV